MKETIFTYMLFLSLSCFGQTKQEQLIDSVLVANTTKTYQEYLAHFKKVDKEYKNVLNKLQKNSKKEGDIRTFPTIPNKKYSSKEFPIVEIHNRSKSNNLKNFKELSFTKIKKVSFLENPRATALYGSQGQYGVYIIEVE